LVSHFTQAFAHDPDNLLVAVHYLLAGCEQEMAKCSAKSLMVLHPYEQGLEQSAECSIFVPTMDPTFTYTVADLASDEAIQLRCDCRTRTFDRGELAALVGWDARLHLVGLNRALRCRHCGEPPFHGWVVSATSSP
jgi:hypothetical protein